MNARSIMFAVLAAAAVTPVSIAQVRLPSEFETPGENLSRLFSYFGGVQSYGVNHSTATVHSGNSLEVWCNFRPDAFGFTVAGFGVGTYGVAAPALAIPAAADTFSVTIQPPASGQLSFFITVREDDNADGVIDVGVDDEWETPITLLSAGTAAYNFPFAAFEDTDPAAGNGVRNFTTSGRLAFFITFETRAAYPGGMVTVPVTLRVDHMGFYVGPQSIPVPPSCPADHNHSGTVSVQDIFDYLDDWFFARPVADFNGIGGITAQDIYDYLTAWNAGCPA